VVAHTLRLFLLVTYEFNCALSSFVMASRASSLSAMLHSLPRGIITINKTLYLCLVHSRWPSIYVTLVHTFVRYILVDYLFTWRSYTHPSSTFSLTIRLRDACYICLSGTFSFTVHLLYGIYSFTYAVNLTLVHTVFHLVCGSLRLAPIIYSYHITTLRNISRYI